MNNLKMICADKANFPKLREMNFDANAYNEFNNGFDNALRAACDQSVTGVTIEADNRLSQPKEMCGNISRSYGYYNLSDEKEMKQCRYTWNWELFDEFTQYSSNGPYPMEDTPDCSS